MQVSSYYTGKNGRFNSDAMAFTLSNDNLYLKIYFSYETVIAFQLNDILAISENVYSVTTAKHLKAINSNYKSLCVPRTDFEHRLNIIIASLGILSTKSE